MSSSEVRVALGIFALLFVVGAGAIALWIDMRQPGLAPATVRRTLVHVGVTLVVAQLVVPIAFRVATGSERLAFATVFVVAFPGLVYCLLVGIWTLKLMQSALRGRFR